MNKPAQVIIGSCRLLIDHLLAIIANLGWFLHHELLQLLCLLLEVRPASIVARQTYLILDLLVLDLDGLII